MSKLNKVNKDSKIIQCVDRVWDRSHGKVKKKGKISINQLTARRNKFYTIVEKMQKQAIDLLKDFINFNNHKNISTPANSLVDNLNIYVQMHKCNNNNFINKFKNSYNKFTKYYIEYYYALNGLWGPMLRMVYDKKLTYADLGLERVEVDSAFGNSGNLDMQFDFYMCCIYEGEYNKTLAEFKLSIEILNILNGYKTEQDFTIEIPEYYEELSALYSDFHANIVVWNDYIYDEFIDEYLAREEWEEKYVIINNRQEYRQDYNEDTTYYEGVSENSKKENTKNNNNNNIKDNKEQSILI